MKKLYLIAFLDDAADLERLEKERPRPRVVALSGHSAGLLRRGKIAYAHYLDYIKRPDWPSINKEIAAQINASLPSKSLMRPQRLPFWDIWSNFLAHEISRDYLLIKATAAVLKKERPDICLLKTRSTRFENGGRYAVVKDVLKALRVPYRDL